MSELKIVNLHAEIDGVKILKGVDLTLREGEVHALMGPNGSGKSTLSSVIMGHPAYEVTEGQIFFNGEDILELDPDERALMGLFLCFQYPVGIPGVSVSKFLKSAADARVEGEGTANASEFLKNLRANMEYLEMERDFANRDLNDGFSGGEKKRMEILQMLMLQPSIAVLDETDSGLDVDALQVVSQGVNKMVGPNFGALVITHYERILNYIKPSTLHIMVDGRIVLSGGPDLVKRVENEGYEWVRNEEPAAV